MDPAAGQALRGAEKKWYRSLTALAYRTYAGFNKCLSGHLWSLIPILNQKLNTQMPQFYQNYSLA